MLSLNNGEHTGSNHTPPTNNPDLLRGMVQAIFRLSTQLDQMVTPPGTILVLVHCRLIITTNIVGMNYQTLNLGPILIRLLGQTMTNDPKWVPSVNNTSCYGNPLFSVA